MATPEQDESRNVNPESSFPGLAVTLEEARRRYDDEEQRRISIESKTSMVIGIDALIISLVSGLLDFGTIISIIVITPALLSVYFGLRNLELRDYGRPGNEIDEFYKYAQLGTAEAKDQFLLSYIGAVEKNLQLNEQKISKFRASYLLSAISIGLLAITPLVVRLFEYLGFL